VEEVVSLYPLPGVGYEKVEEEGEWETVGEGIHKNIGRFAP